MSAVLPWTVCTVCTSSFRNNFAASLVLYWPRLLKQSNKKWLAHTKRFLPPVVGTLPSKINSFHLAHLSSEAWGQCSTLCSQEHSSLASALSLLWESDSGLDACKQTNSTAVLHKVFLNKWVKILQGGWYDSNESRFLDKTSELFVESCFLI